MSLWNVRMNKRVPCTGRCCGLCLHCHGGEVAWSERNYFSCHKKGKSDRRLVTIFLERSRLPIFLYFLGDEIVPPCTEKGEWAQALLRLGSVLCGVVGGSRGSLSQHFGHDGPHLLAADQVAPLVREKVHRPLGVGCRGRGRERGCGGTWDKLERTRGVKRMLVGGFSEVKRKTCLTDLMV